MNEHLIYSVLMQRNNSTRNDTYMQHNKSQKHHAKCKTEHKRPHTVWQYLCDPRREKTIYTEAACHQGRRRDGLQWGHKESFEDDGNVLYPECAISQVCTSVKTHQIVHVKWMQFIIAKLHIDKIDQKTEKKKRLVR